MGDTSDKALLEAARAGDRQALETLLERHQAKVYRFGLKMCRNPEDAKDILQDTLLAMARSVRDFRGASSMSTWLYSIARSFCIKKHRKARAAPEGDDALPSEAKAEAAGVSLVATDLDEVVAGKQIEAALEKAISGLDPMYREVLVLRDVEGLTAPEVAEVLGLTVEAVKSRLHRARLSVRAELAPLWMADRPAPATPAAPAPAPAAAVPVPVPERPSCPDVLMLFSQHVEGDISANVCAQMEKHLEACGRCRSACDSLRQTLNLCQTSSSSNSAQVPAPVQESVRRALRDILRTESP